MISRKKGVLAALAAVAAVGAGGVAIAGATGGDDDDATEKPISGQALDKASSAALAHVGEGRVTDTEVGDEESLYEVEVRKDDGTEVDVQLDDGFQVVGAEADGNEDENEGDEAGNR